MENYTYSRTIGTGTVMPAVWDKTVKAELTDAGRDVWQKELDARDAVLQAHEVASPAESNSPASNPCSVHRHERRS